MRRRWIWVAAAVSLAVVVGAVHARNSRPSTRPETPASAQQAAAPVVVAPVVTRDVGRYLTGLGAVTALNTVTVRSRVDGQLMTVRFQEGQLVHRGDLLAELDARPFQAQLEQAEGQLVRDQALLENARVDLGRYEVLVRQDAVPKQQVDTQRALVQQYEGVVKADQGQADTARVLLAYCRIASPIDGRVGLRLVDSGNIVHAADTSGIVVITQLTPITVVFTIPEDSIPSVVAEMKRGARLPVEAYDREQRRKLTTGSLLTLDNQVDQATGTVKLKALFDNTDQALFPNQFVNARLQLGVARGATVVPAAAIQRASRGPFVYVVTADRTVEARPVTVGVTDADVVAIDRGVIAGEQVVVDGAEKLRDGSTVAPQASASRP